MAVYYATLDDDGDGKINENANIQKFHSLKEVEE